MTRRALASLAAAAAVASTTAGVGCLLLRDVDSLTASPGAGATPEGGDADIGPTTEGGADAPLDSDSDGGAPCPGTAGPPGVRVGAYCIDSTEVTVKHYRAFLDARAGDTSGQPAACAWNTTFAPLGGVPGTGSDDQPIANVDFCDAVAYCAWAGKHLCGAISGAPLTTADRANAARSEWFRACSRNNDGLHPYPYGGAYEPQRCNGVDRDSGILPVGSLAACQGAYPGVFDLSGNVREWEDACDDGATATDRTCLTRGGGYYDFEGTLQCDNQQAVVVTTQNIGVGLRCCAR
jgi:sulfatase modifying factor 1